jgi:hypothetical protein
MGRSKATATASAGATGNCFTRTGSHGKRRLARSLLAVSSITVARTSSASTFVTSCSSHSRNTGSCITNRSSSAQDVAALSVRQFVPVPARPIAFPAREVAHAPERSNKDGLNTKITGSVPLASHVNADAAHSSRASAWMANRRGSLTGTTRIVRFRPMDPAAVREALRT